MDQEKTLQSILETVEFVKDNAATKEDLKDFATKEDLAGFATKEDLNNFATKEDLKGEINSLEQRMDSRIDNLEQRLDSKLTEAKDEIITQIDKFIVLHQKLDLEMSAFRSRFERLELEMQKSFKNRNSEA